MGGGPLFAAKVLLDFFALNNLFLYGKTFLIKKKCCRNRNAYLGKRGICLTFASGKKEI
jgi:hypothetical protein